VCPVPPFRPDGATVAANAEPELFGIGPWLTPALA
jgi:hypothetical protein